MNFKPSSPRLQPAPDASSRDTSDSKRSDSSSEAAHGDSERAAADATGNVVSGTTIYVADPELRLENALRSDRYRLQRQKKRLSKEAFADQLRQSVETRKLKQSYEPCLEYPSDLPISSHREEILELLGSRQVLVVCGETGSGKSTQLPKLCLEAGLGRDGMIGHTQPRRLAARSVAARVAEEMKCKLGEQVGYQVRFGDHTGDQTLIKLMTDGILLTETRTDRFLNRYDAILIDEAHERSLNIDFLMGYLRQLQAKRPDLKIVITSATIDAEKFAEHFADENGPAPIVNVEGRGYPVEIRNLPWEEVVGDEFANYDLARHVIAGLESLSRSGQGDTLVFLPTERDIRWVSHHVAGHYKRLGLEKRVEVLPLYARLPQQEQQRIFRPSGNHRRLIFATNVAESSLTVPGIRYVIDTGTARMSRYSPRSKLQRLPIEPISQASANQRAGRCGRIGPGICLRLYSTEDFESRDPFTTPEIRRTNLASVLLQCKMLGFHRLEELPLLDVPREESIREGAQTLTELGAIDDRQELTPIGKQLGRMPVDPRIGRILLAAEEHGCLAEVLPIAAALEIPDPRTRPQDKQQAADESHSEFQDGESDFLALLRLWRFYEQSKAELSRNKLTKTLVKRFLSPNNMREWAETYRQLCDVARDLFRDRKKGRTKIGKIRYADEGSAIVEKDCYASIHKALLTGFLSGVATLGEKNGYLGPRGLQAFLWPGSGLFESKPKWIVTSEWVETSKQYARTVARIQPQWVEEVGSHLLKDSFGDPHWSSKARGAFCYQRRSLFGLPIVAKRRVPLPPIDPITARELLIEHGLVERQLQTSARFVRHNRGLRDAFEVLAAKTRRRDLVIDEHAVRQFYYQNLPQEVCDKGRLEKFAKQTAAPDWVAALSDSAKLSEWLDQPPTIENDSSHCFMEPRDLIDISVDAISLNAFPDQLTVGKTELPLAYRYEPGADDDGISLRIHQSAITQVSDERLGWLVPGLLHTKIVALIKALPKRIRRNLVPAADVAKRVEEELMPKHGEVPFLPALCESLSRHAEMEITDNDFQADKIEPHLEFLVNVVDDDGKTLAQGRSVTPLVRRFGAAERTQQEPGDSDSESEFSPEPMTSFDIDRLPVEAVRQRGGVQVAQYPAFHDKGDSVVVRLYADRTTADAAMMQGLVRLYAIAEKKELRRQVRWLPEMETIKVRLSGVIRSGDLESALMDLLARIAFVDPRAIPRTREAFESARSDRGEKIAVAVQSVAGWLGSLAENHLKMRSDFESFQSSSCGSIQEDVRRQLDWLFHDRFLSTTPWQWLKNYPKYLAAISHRLDKARSGATKRDAEGMEEIAGLCAEWLASIPESDRNPHATAGSEFRWMLEELRVSLFAQSLGTSIKVSPARCRKWLEKQ
ncbi:MAG: ATP-dependent RNA helicase HrpA [Planctomycetota bacterium]